MSPALDWPETWQAFAYSHWHPDLYAPSEPPRRETFAADKKFIARFPRFAELLERANCFQVRAVGNNFVPSAAYLVYAWRCRDANVMGWWCYPPSKTVAAVPFEDHSLLLSRFGGIHVYWNEPPGILSNLDHQLLCEATPGIHGGNEDEFWQLCKYRKVSGEIDPADYMTFARYPTGDALAYHRESGAVIGYAPHFSPRNGSHVRTYEDLILRFEDIPDFHAWVERLAGEHLSAIAS